VAKREGLKLPSSFEEAVADLLKVKPPRKAAKPRQKRKVVKKQKRSGKPG
jgi:hypothetical protein